MGVLGGQLAPTRIDLVWHSRTFSPARKSRSTLRKKRRISNAISSNIPCVVTVCFIYVFWSCEYCAGFKCYAFTTECSKGVHYWQRRAKTSLEQGFFQVCYSERHGKNIVGSGFRVGGVYVQNVSNCFRSNYPARISERTSFQSKLLCCACILASKEVDEEVFISFERSIIFECNKLYVYIRFHITCIRICLY